MKAFQIGKEENSNVCYSQSIRADHCCHTCALAFAIKRLLETLENPGVPAPKGAGSPFFCSRFLSPAKAGLPPFALAVASGSALTSFSCVSAFGLFFGGLGGANGLI